MEGKKCIMRKGNKFKLKVFFLHTFKICFSSFEEFENV